MRAGGRSSSWYVDTRITFVSGAAAVISRVAAMPSSSPMLMSISTRSGAWLRWRRRLLAGLDLGDQLEPVDAIDHGPRRGAERGLIVDDHHGHTVGHDCLLPASVSHGVGVAARVPLRQSGCG